MSIKMIALAAATVVGTASLAQANSYFAISDNLDAASVLQLGTVRAAGNGTVEIYSYQGGVQGDLLGSTMVNAGANNDVRVNVGVAPKFDVIAVLNVNGQTVAIKDYDINRM